MKLDDIEIKNKVVVGKNLRNDVPVIMVETYGGLYAIFANMGGLIECVGAAPHKAIAVHLAEAKWPGMFEWDRNAI